MKKSKTTEEIINEIITLYSQGEFGKVINIVDENLEVDNSDLLTKKIYSFSLLRTGNIFEAEYIIDKALEGNPEDSELLNAMGYIQIMKGNKTPALNYLLDADYYSQGETKERIKSNLKLFSEYPDINTLKSIVKPKDFLILSLPKVKKKLLKMPNFKLPTISSKIMAILGVIALTFGVIYLVLSNLLNKTNTKDIVSENISRIELESATKLVEPKPILTNDIRLSEKEISSIFNEIRILLSKDRSSNKARFLANYLLNSNASTEVKSKVEVLKTFMEEPDINLDWQPIYEEVSSKPTIYDGVYVSWRGKVVNAVKQPNYTEFTFLIYGDNESIVKGFIKGVAKEFLDGYIGQNIRVIGKITVSKDIVLEVKRVVGN
ncbi:MAG: hypothetical protein RMJ37_01055 [Spirochaetia bacterium]|nr:hypothetical protein [Spirochaetota bacterium]MCX8097007.1 hypothetical protein [Spirochaetota bacterium]MDW8111910.1 hypothetical protein [Spirochaetia bacterium]